MQDALKKEAEDRSNEFVEGIHFSQDFGVVVKGCFSDGPARNERISTIGAFSMNMSLFEKAAYFCII